MTENKRYQPSIREAHLRMWKIPVLGMGPVFAFALSFSKDFVAALFASLLVGVLFYIPLFGLLFFETKNWIEIEEGGLRIQTDGEIHFFAWADIEYVKISRDTLIINDIKLENKKVISFLRQADKEHIYNVYFETVGFKPNQTSYSASHPGYLNWEHRNKQDGKS